MRRIAHKGLDDVGDDGCLLRGDEVLDAREEVSEGIADEGVFF